MKAISWIIAITPHAYALMIISVSKIRIVATIASTNVQKT